MVVIHHAAIPFSTHRPEVEARSLASRIGSFSREITINTLFLISGIGLFFRKSWRHKPALTILVISTFYTPPLSPVDGMIFYYHEEQCVAVVDNHKYALFCWHNYRNSKYLSIYINKKLRIRPIPGFLFF